MSSHLISQKQWVQNVFDGAAPEYGRAGCCFFQHFGRSLVSFSGVEPGADVLDVATGKGAVLFPLINSIGSEGSVSGIDLSANMVSETQRQLDIEGKDWVCVQQMDAEKLDFPDCSFDFVFCGFALFFFPSLKKALSEFRRVLRPGGYLVVSIWGEKPKLTSWAVEEAKKLLGNGRLAVTSLKDSHSLFEALEGEGFFDVQLLEERKVFQHESTQAWWKSLWSHGTRAYLEKLSKAQLDDIYERALLRVESNSKEKGISEELHSIFAKAKKA